MWRWWFTGFQYEGAVEVAVEVAVIRGEEAEGGVDRACK